MNLKRQLEAAISAALADLAGRPDCPAMVARAKEERFGDYQANGVMPLAKRLKRNPRELGAALAEQLDLGGMAEKVELAGPGFVNIFISPDYLANQLQTLAATGLVQPTEKPGAIVVDYSSPNLAKEMHVGHLRGTIIGDALVRVFEHLGHSVIRQNHFGDWGTQFGMLLARLEELTAGAANISHALTDLEFFYREAKERFDNDPAFAAKSRENVVKLQNGDPRCLKLWREFVSVSIDHCQALYEKLGIALSRDHIAPESFYNPKLEGIVAALSDQGLLAESSGAKCVFLDEFKNKQGQPLPAIIQKSDGGYLYATTDLAALQYRSETLQADRILYVVDARQSLHFQQVFAIARRAGLVRPDCSLEHLSYGAMLDKSGRPFKTRSGGTVKLIDLVDESISRAHKLARLKNPALSAAEQEEVARVVGIAAIKYAELSKNRNGDYVFDWNAMLSFEGNTAPYLLYAYARIQSLFRKGSSAAEERTFALQISAKEEKRLALKILQLGEVLEAVAQDCYPNQLCLYLYELAGLYMQFYEACPVLKAKAAVRDSRLGLSHLAARTLKQGLALLGIETLERM